MVLCYRETNDSLPQAQALYEARFGRRPSTRVPGHSRGTGTGRIWVFNPPEHHYGRPRFDPDFEESRGAGGPACGMECGVAASGYPAHPAHPAHPALSPTERSPAKSGLHVNFSDKGEVKERREKFLTAKYGSHQMALIRKRLAVEMWLYDELQKLYELPTLKEGAGSGAGAGATEVEVDIDELLDMEGDDHRRHHLTKLLADAKKPQKDVHKFINELLEKAKTL